MQIAQQGTCGPRLPSAANGPSRDSPAPRFAATPHYKIIRRNGAVVGFEPAKISVAMTKAFLAVNGGQGAASARIRELVAGADRGRSSARWCAASRRAAPSTSRTSRTRSSSR